MTEQEYIYVRDLGNILTAEHALRDCNPGHSVISEDEHKKVMAVLQRWRIELFAKVETSE